MPISKQKKQEVVAEISELLTGSKMTVFARYSGTSVQSMQLLRTQSRDSGTKIKVVKNRLFKKALAQNSSLASVDTNTITGQLIFAFNAADEVAPAQNIANFAKLHPQIKLMGAITEDGQLLTADEINHLASLPSKDSLRGQLVGVISAPNRNFVSALSANLQSVLGVLGARRESLQE